MFHVNKALQNNFINSYSFQEMSFPVYKTSFDRDEKAFQISNIFRFQNSFSEMSTMKAKASSSSTTSRLAGFESSTQLYFFSTMITSGQPLADLPSFTLSRLHTTWPPNKNWYALGVVRKWGHTIHDNFVHFLKNCPQKFLDTLPFKLWRHLWTDLKMLYMLD